MRKAMFGAHIQANEPLHWICYVDASRVREDEPGIIPPYMSLLIALVLLILRVVLHRYSFT